MKKKIISTLFSVIVLQSSLFSECDLLCSGFGSAACPSPFGENSGLQGCHPKDPFFYLSYFTGQYVTIDQNYARAGIFMPLGLSDAWDGFLNAQGISFFDEKWGFNGGFGIRKGCVNSAVGFNFFYDLLSTEYRRTFQQIGVGFDWLHPCWDLRVNGYFPFVDSTKETLLCSFNNFSDGFLAEVFNIQYAYTGFDAEIGFPFLCFGGFSMYFASGPYYYFKQDQERFWGGYARLELTWRSNFLLEFKISHDSFNHTNYQFMLQISVPFEFVRHVPCHTCSTPQLDRPVHRNEVIMLDHFNEWTWNW